LLANLAMWPQAADDVRGSIGRNTVKYGRAPARRQHRAERPIAGALAMRGMIFNTPTRPASGRRSPFHRRWKEHFGTKAWAMLEAHVGKLG